MTPFTSIPQQIADLADKAADPSRRDFLKTTGLFVVSVGALGPAALSASEPGGAARTRTVPGSRLPPARCLDRDSPGQHRDLLRRQDRSRAGHRHGVPPDHVRRARLRLRPLDRDHGQHRRHRRSGRIRRIGRAPDRRLADAARRRRGAPRARRDGREALRRADRSARGQRRRDHGAERSVEARDLRRADWRPPLQRHADGQEHRHRDRHRKAEAGAAVEARGHVAAALRHPAEGGRFVEVGS